LSSRAISPKKSPEPSRDRITSRPSSPRIVPFEDHEEEVAFLVLEEDHGVLGVAAAGGDAGQAQEVRVVELREDGDRPQELTLVHG
jgi:hypothetical protein